MIRGPVLVSDSSEKKLEARPWQYAARIAVHEPTIDKSNFFLNLLFLIYINLDQLKSFENAVASSENYHHRKTPEKRFKLVPKKVAFRPRLKIRRPGEAPPAPLNMANNEPVRADRGGSSPIALPELTPFRALSAGGISVLSQPIALPSIEPQPASRRSVYDSLDDTEDPTLVQNLASEEPLKLLRLPAVTKWEGDENPPILPATVTPLSPQLALVPTTPAKPIPMAYIEEEWSRGSVGEQPPQPSKSLKAKAAAVKTATAEVLAPLAPEEDLKALGFAAGDSALSFGGDIGTPPPGFREAFGLNGAEELFPTQSTTVVVVATTSTTELPITTTIQEITM